MPVGHYDRTRIPRRGRPGFLRGILGDLDRTWMSRAACRMLPPDRIDELFFPVYGRSHADRRRYRELVSEAKAICRGCPVISQCEGYRASLQDPNGVWGGRDELDRNPTRRPAAGDPAGRAECVVTTKPAPKKSGRHRARPPRDGACPGSSQPPATKPVRGYGICSGCGERRALRADGRIFNHNHEGTP